MDRKQLESQLKEMGITVKDGMVKKSEIQAALQTLAKPDNENSRSFPYTLNTVEVVARGMDAKFKVTVTLDMDAIEASAERQVEYTKSSNPIGYAKALEETMQDARNELKRLTPREVASLEDSGDMEIKLGKFEYLKATQHPKSNDFHFEYDGSETSEVENPTFNLIFK